MKRLLSISFLALSILFGVSCQKNNDTSIISESLTTSSENEESTSTPIQNSKWGQEYNEIIISTLGEDIPYIECNNFEIVLAKDDYQDDMVVFYLYFDDNLESKLEEYSQIATLEGYIVEKVENSYFDPVEGYYSYEVYYADKQISSSLGIEMQFLIGSYKNKDCVGIFAYNYVIDEVNAWPTNLVVSLLGYDVPHLEDTGEYNYYAKINAEGYIDIIIYNVQANAEDEYCALLEANGYVVTEEQYDPDTGEYMGRYAYAENGEVVIQFGLSQYGLEIYIYKIA